MAKLTTKSTISQVISMYLDTVYLARSEATYRTYKTAMKKFCEVLTVSKLDPDETDISDLSEDAIAWLAAELKSYSLPRSNVISQQRLAYMNISPAKRSKTLTFPGCGC